MKKSKTKARAGGEKARRAAKPKETSKPRSAANTGLVSTDIRKSYKNRLLREYFNRPH
jgi:hypothetical protein